jgi:dTDP-4-dehydrorhamnose reductase
MDSKIAEADITDKSSVAKVIEDYQPDVVINTAAKTNLEWCSNNKQEAFEVNVLGADNIAQVCDENDIYFIHFSSGCIFQSEDESDVKTEGSEPDPQAYYSWTKVWSENLIPFEKSDNFNYAILRPRQPVSAKVSNKNMLIKMLTFTRYVDTPNTGTVIEDLMDWTLQIIKKKPTGVIHVANPGWVTPYEIAMLLKEIILPELDPIKITKEELDKMVPNKRVDTVLEMNRLREMGIEPVAYRDRIRDVIVNLKENMLKLPKSELEEILEKTVEESKQRTIVNKVWKNLIENE